MRNRASSAGTLLACTAALTTICGCISPENDRLAIGESLRLPATGYSGETPPPDTTWGKAEAPASPAPSVTGIDRSNWRRTDIAVPVDGTAHNPLYVTNTFAWTDGNARQRGDYPTVESALDEASDVEGQQWDAVAAPFVGAFDVLAIIPRMFVQPPLSTRYEPSSWYQRYWLSPTEFGPQAGTPTRAETVSEHPAAPEDAKAGDSK